MKTRIRFHTLAATWLLMQTWTHAQDFRSAASGNWHILSTWEQSTDGGNTWVNATNYPTASNSNSITVRSPHAVTLDNTIGAITIHGLVIQNGATVTNSAGCHVFKDDSSEPIDIQIFGTYNGSSPCGSMVGPGVVSVESGGFALFNGPAGSAVNFGTLTVQNGGTVTSNTYHRAVGPFVNNGTFTVHGEFRVANTPVNNGILNVNGDVLWNTANGTLTNTGTLTVTNGNLRLEALTAMLHNNGTLNVNGSSLGEFTNNGAGGQAWNNNAAGSYTLLGLDVQGVQVGSARLVRW